MIADGPNEDEKTEKKEEFWNELTDIVENLVDRTIILGDLNGRLGSKYNRTIEVKGRYGKIATWNIRSITGKERELITEFGQANLDILGITETKKKKQGIMEMKGEHVLIYSGCKQKHEGKIRSGMHCQERA